MIEKSAFQIISEAVDKTGVSCVLIGGFAVNFYKYARQTIDVDFLITEDSLSQIAEFLADNGYKKKFSQDVFARFISDKPGLATIDFMFVDKDTLHKIIKNGKEVSVAKYNFIIPSLENLIALKLHSLKNNFKDRLVKDIPDIVSLARINNIDVKSGDFKEMCLKFGTEEIYSKILENF